MSLHKYLSGTQQLDFPGNCQCRAQVRIFDTTQMGYFVNYWYLDIVTLSRGSLQYKRGILGHRKYRTFDFRQRLPSGEYSFLQDRSLRKYAHM